MASRAPVSAVLPIRDGDPPARPRLVPGERSAPEAILSCAETLGIPWRRILLQEIEAEQKLRTYLSDVEEDCSLETAVAILSACAARSWRVRDRLETLACQSRVSARGARTRLRRFLRRLAGESDAEATAMARHCRFAHERILLLQRARRAAARSRGTPEERLAFVCTTARCAFEDAEWALRVQSSARPGRRMDAAIRKVREEGFLVPRAATEARSLGELRRILASAGV
jgi:hypothetical protein